MRHLMFCIHDVKAGAYMQPWFLPTEGMAIRGFADCVNKVDHNFFNHPEDYTLFLIGEFDDSDGHVEVCAHRSLGNGVDFVSDRSVSGVVAVEDAIRGNGDYEGMNKERFNEAT